jgi:hypothetical protein
MKLFPSFVLAKDWTVILGKEDAQTTSNATPCTQNRDGNAYEVSRTCNHPKPSWKKQPAVVIYSIISAKIFASFSKTCLTMSQTFGSILSVQVTRPWKFGVVDSQSPFVTLLLEHVSGMRKAAATLPSWTSQWNLVTPNPHWCFKYFLIPFPPHKSAAFVTPVVVSRYTL